MDNWRLLGADPSEAKGMVQVIFRRLHSLTEDALPSNR